MANVVDRLALAALRGVVAELEDDPAGAGEVLTRLFGAGPTSSTPAPGAPALRVEAPASEDPEDPAHDRGEGQRLARALLERRGSPAAVVAAHPHFTAAALRSWASGARRPSPVSLEALRAAAGAPPPGSPEAPAASEGQDDDAGDDPEGER